MRVVVQRVTEARVRVDGDVVGEVGPGLCVLIGVTHDDDEGVARRMAEKVANLRVFDDEAGVMNRALVDRADPAVLVVSQFTLYGDTRRGRRPSWAAAARPEQAEPLVDAFARDLRELGIEVSTGHFGADMRVELVNDGPVTLVVEL